MSLSGTKFSSPQSTITVAFHGFELQRYAIYGFLYAQDQGNFIMNISSSYSPCCYSGE